jgi:hypothetical protein
MIGNSTGDHCGSSIVSSFDGSSWSVVQVQKAIQEYQLVPLFSTGLTMEKYIRQKNIMDLTMWVHITLVQVSPSLGLHR